MGIFDRFSINKFMKDLKGEDRNIERLGQILERSDCDIDRGKAAKDLGRIGGERAVEILIKTLKDESGSQYSEYIRTEVARSLGKIGDKRAVWPLFNLLETSYYTSEKCFRPLGGGFPIPYEKVRHPETVINRAYIRISDKNWFARIDAAKALGKIGGEDAIKALIKALKNERQKDVGYLDNDVVSTIESALKNAGHILKKEDLEQ